MGLQFVLIHGGWHHGGHWENVIRSLEEAGHQAYAPTLLGNEPGAQRINYPLKERIQRLRDDIVSRNLMDFVLVAHSAGGQYAQELAQLEPHRVRRIVFVSAVILKDGESFRMLSGQRSPHNRPVERSSENFFFPREIPLEWWQKSFANTVDPETATSLHATLVPQGGQSFSEPHDLKAFFKLRIPMSYIHIISDVLPETPNIRPGEGWHPWFSRRLGSEFRLVQMAGDHEVLLTAPASLAQKLVEASCDELFTEPLKVPVEPCASTFKPAAVMNTLSNHLM